MLDLKKYVVTIRLDKEACPWLKDEVVEVGTVVTETGDFYGCCGKGGTFVEGGGLECPTELPTAALELVDAVDFRKAARTGKFFN